MPHTHTHTDGHMQMAAIMYKGTAFEVLHDLPKSIFTLQFTKKKKKNGKI